MTYYTVEMKCVTKVHIKGQSYLPLIVVCHILLHIFRCWHWPKQMPPQQGKPQRFLSQSFKVQCLIGLGFHHEKDKTLYLVITPFTFDVTSFCTENGMLPVFGNHYRWHKGVHRFLIHRGITFSAITHKVLLYIYQGCQLIKQRK